MNRLAIVGAKCEVDNTGPVGSQEIFPTMDTHISAGRYCKDFDQGSAMIGTLIADDLRFCGSSLSTEPKQLQRRNATHERCCDH